MRLRVFVLIFFLLAIAPMLRGQQKPASASLTESQREGRRLYQQKCAVCHVPVNPTSLQYGPALFRGVVAGKEELIRKSIADGMGDRMPGWKHTLSSQQITAIIDYLKTLDKPAATITSARDEM